MHHPPLTEEQFRRTMKAIFNTRKGAGKAAVRRRIQSLQKKLGPHDRRAPMVAMLQKTVEVARQR